MRPTVLLCLSLAVCACSKKEPDAVPKGEPVEVTPKSAPSAKAIEKTPEHSFRLVKEFGRPVRYFPVGSAAVVCEGECAFKKGPALETWRVDEKGVHEDASLWPGSSWQRFLSSMEGEGYDSIEVSYLGKYPRPLFATAYTGSRTGEVLPPVSFDGKGWETTDMAQADVPSHATAVPRRYHHALLTAPVSFVPSDHLVYGAGGPVLLAESRKLHVYRDDAWHTQPAPFGNSPKAVRLKSGETLVLHGDGATLLSRDLVPDSIAFTSSNGKPVLIGAVQPLVVGTAIYAKADSGKTLYRPKELERFRAAPPEPEREPAPALPASSGDAGDAAPAGPVEMPAAVGFYDACKAPFVILATPPHMHHDYATTGNGLKGNYELADKLSFVEFERKGTVYFGAQAKDEASARKLIELVQANIPGMKPQLGCLDAMAQIPDPYHPPQKMRVVFLHLGSGRLLSLE